MAEPGSAEAHLDWLVGKTYRLWLDLADKTSDLTDVIRAGDVVRATLDGKPISASISYDG